MKIHVILKFSRYGKLNSPRRAFVTGATGLLGNNLVRELVARGVSVKALVRSETKGMQQFAGLKGVELVLGDMADVPAFSAALQGCDVVFHTAAFFRDNFKGGSHWKALKRINVDGTRQLIERAYEAGIRRFVQTSSIAVLNGEPGMPIDETCLRDLADADDDYYRSKILADQVVSAFLETHPDMHASFVLPGWMWGPPISARLRQDNLSTMWCLENCLGCCQGASRLSMLVM